MHRFVAYAAGWLLGRAAYVVEHLAGIVGRAEDAWGDDDD